MTTKRAAKRTRYGLSIDTADAQGPTFLTSAEAMRGAYRSVRHDSAQVVTVLRFEEFRGGELRITPLVVVTPPEARP